MAQHNFTTVNIRCPPICSLAEAHVLHRKNSTKALHNLAKVLRESSPRRSSATRREERPEQLQVPAERRLVQGRLAEPVLAVRVRTCVRSGGRGRVLVWPVPQCRVTRFGNVSRNSEALGVVLYDI